MASSCGDFIDPCQSDQIMNLSITPPHEKKKSRCGFMGVVTSSTASPPTCRLLRLSV
ncbi:uncharacterized protein BKA55DRAFT_578816 [Fusarium redolens]|uniref:Uncharacterized protein n=1 Tax=Fusarium redolens TaxID=48865 RepID=A0A9P9GDM3_FUSRE|nr:uncharacterized protein BKA55DRAFT_578816 [Fusarium redolens]KAH7236946.1 hypothetical protein BKA55DRAFT_578816 [Fusarium redolens]